MTRTTNSFGALALTILTVFALWTSTLASPAGSTATSTTTVAVDKSPA
jgi:hypothetical protein